MLILTRKAEESVMVDGTAEIVVLKIRGNRVALGFRTCDGTKIVRTELIEHEEALTNG